MGSGGRRLQGYRKVVPLAGPHTYYLGLDDVFVLCKDSNVLSSSAVPVVATVLKGKLGLLSLCSLLVDPLWI